MLAKRDGVEKALAWALADVERIRAQEDGPLAAEGPNGFGVRLLDGLADLFGAG